MKYIKVDKEWLDQTVSELDEVLSKFKGAKSLMLTSIYATRNAYRNVLRRAVLAEKKEKEENSNQIKMEI